MRTFRFGLLLGGILLAGASTPVDGLRLHTEGGAVWFSRNDVRIPGEGGTRFDLLDSGWYLAAGYRTLEGGADNDSAHTLAWLHYALAAIRTPSRSREVRIGFPDTGRSRGHGSRRQSSSSPTR